MATAPNALSASPAPLKPLRGVRVLSLALNLPGPAALMRLRAMGATCTKAEPPAPAGMPAGTPGELVVRHSAATPRKGFFSGYLKNAEATDEAWTGGWFHTGDVAMRDEEGTFYFMDRKKNIIRRSGENIAAAEVEACLTFHEKVKQVAVIAVPDELREEEVMACIVTKSPADATADFARELLAWSLERVAYFKAPAWVMFVDSLPTGTSQKVQKIHLFPAGTDPRTLPGVVDLRNLKKKPKAQG